MIELYGAIFKFQGLIRGVKKDSENPHYKNKYASLEAVIDTIRPCMQETGLIWYQQPGEIKDNSNSILVTTIIAHAESGQSISSTMEMPLAKRDPQGTGSALTYAMRYSLMAILGLPPTDDDAETAIDRDNFRDNYTPTQKISAYDLKKNKSWETTMQQLDNDFLDVKNIGDFKKLKDDYLHSVSTQDGWPKTWIDALDDEFENRLKERMKQKRETKEKS